jgi:hypothetical protein
MARLQFHCSPASTLHGAFLHENTAARPVEFRYADPPEGGIQQGERIPLSPPQADCKELQFCRCTTIWQTSLCAS